MSDKFVTFSESRATATGLPAPVDSRVASRADLDAAIIGTGGVVSPSVARLLTYRVGDVAPDTAPGDLLIEYLAHEQFFVNFTGEITAEWEQKIKPGPWVIIDDATATDGKALTLQTPYDNGPHLISFVPAESGLGVGEQVEILARVKGSYTNESINTAIATRMSGAVGSVSGLMLAVYAGELRISQFINGNQTRSAIAFTPPADSWIMLRLRVAGNEVYAKAWVSDEPEPTEWMITTTTTVAPGGMTGLYSFQPTFTRWDYVGIATGNTSAPSEAVS